MSAKGHASLYVLLAVLLFLGAISGPAQAQVTLSGIQITLPVSGLNSPNGVAVDGAGDIFIADTGNNRVVEVPAGGGAQITVPVSGLSSPIGVAVDTGGDLFIADAGNSRVVELPAGGGAQTTVGSGLNTPFGVAVDGAGDVFIADTGNNRVVELPAGGGAQTTVGSGLSSPIGVAVDTGGDLFIADAGNNRVVELPAGGGAQITVPVSGLHGLAGVAADGAGDVFIAAAGNSRVVEVPYLGNGMYGTQITVSSGLYSPVGVAVDGAGDLFITDSGRVVEIQRVAGNVAINFGNVNVCPGGQTTPAPCSQTLPLTYNVAAYTTVFATQVVTEGEPGLDFTTSDNNCVGYYNAATTCIVNVTFAPLAPGVRMGAVQFTGNWSYLPVTNMIYGVGEGPVIAFAPSVQSTVPANGLSTPRGVAVDGAGDILIADTGNNWVLMVQADGAQTTVGYGLNFPYGVAVDGAGDVFIADTGNSRVAEVPTYCLYCLNPVPVSGLNSPAGVAVDGAGDLFIADTGNNRVVEVPAGGGAQITVGSGLNSPSGVAVDGTGNVFIADTGNSRVVEVPAGGGAQITVPVSGLNSPTGVAVDAAGDLFIADAGNNRVVEVPYLGNGMYGAQITVGSGLRSPKGVALDGAGDVFIADSGNSRVVKLQRSQPPTLTFASTPVGSTSSDSPQAVTVQNIGNQPLEGYPSGWLGADFFQVANSGSQASCIPSFQLTPGTSCLMSISFEPQSTGSLTATQRFADNTLNLSGFSASQNVTLQGTGLPTVQATATALWSSQNPSISGQAVAFTATIYPQVGGEVTGTVTFKNGNAALATVAVSGNAASLTTSALKAGVHSISAVYSGNANFTGSTSAPLSQLVQNPAVTATWTVLTSSVNPSVSGKPVLFTATVSPQSGAGTPTGKVTFYNGSAELSTVGLSSGTAKYSTTALPAGSNRITAVYGGDTNYSGSTSAAVNQYVIATTTVTLTSSLNPSTYGLPFILSAAVTSAIGAPPDGETVTFKQGTTALGTGNLSGGTASFLTSALAVGTDVITAVYGGDSNFAASTSKGLKQVVSKSASTTTLVSSANPSGSGQSVTFTAVVYPRYSGTPTGTVTFRLGTKVLRTLALSGGTALYTTQTLPVGDNAITATYNGSVDFSGSSAALTQTVN